MLVREVYKHCVKTTKPRHYNHDWTKIGSVWYRKVYCGVMNLDSYNQWSYSNHFEYWEYFSTDLEVDSSVIAGLGFCQ